MPLSIHRIPIIRWLSPYSYQFFPQGTIGGTDKNPPFVVVEFNGPSGGPIASINDVSMMVFQNNTFVSIPSSAIQMGQPSPYWNGNLAWGPNSQPTMNLVFDLKDANGAFLCTGALGSFPNTSANPAGYFTLNAIGQPPPPGGIGEPQFFANGIWSPSTVRGVIVEWIEIGDPFGASAAAAAA